MPEFRRSLQSGLCFKFSSSLYLWSSVTHCVFAYQNSTAGLCRDVDCHASSPIGVACAVFNTSWPCNDSDYTPMSTITFNFPCCYACGSVILQCRGRPRGSVSVPSVYTLWWHSADYGVRFGEHTAAVICSVIPHTQFVLPHRQAPVSVELEMISRQTISLTDTAQ